MSIWDSPIELSSHVPRSVSGRMIATAVGAALVVGLVAVGLLVAYSGLQARTDRIFGGVAVAGVDLSGLSRADARRKLEQDLDPLLAESVSLTHDGGAIRVSMADLGVSLDHDAMVERAYGQGREKGALANLRARRQLKHDGVDLAPVLRTDQGAMRDRISEFTQSFRREAQNARIQVHGAEIVLVPGVTARELDVEGTVGAVLASVTSAGNRSVPVVFKETPPAVTTESLQDVNCVLSQFSTNYPAYKTDRTHNLGLAAGKIDGTCLEPGEEFSYNGVVGPRTAAAGYRMADVFADGEVRPGMGGGVCQPSTTLYDAALLAGLNVTERHHHMMPVSYVRPTRDATVAYDEGLDLRFTNSLSHPILLRASVGGGQLTCSVLGNEADKCEVELVISGESVIPMEEEQVVDETLEPGAREETQKGYGGRTGTLTRIIRKGGAEVERVVLHTDRYSPRKQIWRVGPEKTEDDASTVAGTGSPAAPQAGAGDSPSPAPGGASAGARPAGATAEELFSGLAGG